MSSAIMTMIGMYNYDPTIFDGLKLPEGIDKDTCVNEILSRCGEFEVIYPDIEFLKNMITHFSNKHYWTFEKWVKGLAEEFNPLYNYDRNEVYTDTHDSNASAESETHTNSTVHQNVSAYDSTTMQPKENEISTGGDKGTAKNESKDVIKHEAHLFGNIGVTTSVAMLTEYVNFYKDFNIYKQIADIFCDEFCIAIY